MSSSFCTNCGNPLPEVAKFCAHCGTPVTKPEQMPEVPLEETVENAVVAAPLSEYTEPPMEDVVIEEVVEETAEEVQEEEIAAEEIAEAPIEEVVEQIAELPAEEAPEQITEVSTEEQTEEPVPEPAAEIPQQSPVYAVPADPAPAPVAPVYVVPMPVPQPVYVPGPGTTEEDIRQSKRFGAKEGKRIRSKVGFFRRFFAVLVSFLLFVSVLVTIVVFDVRNLSSQAVIENIVEDIDLSIIPEEQFEEILDETGVTPLRKNEKLDSMINDLYTGKGNTTITDDDVMHFFEENRIYLENEFGFSASQYEVRQTLNEIEFEKISTEDLRDLLDDSPIATLIAAKASSVLEGLYSGEDTSLSRREVQRMVKNINNYLEDEFNVTMPEEYQENITEFFTEGEIFEELKPEMIEENAPVVYTALQIGFSVYLLIFLLVLCLIWMLLIFLCGRCSWTRAAKTIGIVLLIPGMIFTLATGIAEALPALWSTICGNITAISVAAATVLTANAMVSLGVLIAGFVLLIGGSILSRVFRKVGA